MARDITIEQLNGTPLPESVCGALTLAFLRRWFSCVQLQGQKLVHFPTFDAALDEFFSKVWGAQGLRCDIPRRCLILLR
jgi:hypothetical protein